MANHRAAGRAQVRPLHQAQGIHRHSQVATASAVKVGVVGALATATIAVPLASAAADQGIALPQALEATPAQATPVTQAKPAALKKAAPQVVTLTTAKVNEDAAAQYTDAAAGSQIVAKAEEKIVATNAAGEEVEVEVAKDGTWQHPQPGARITSPFGYRKHPVLGYGRMHNGVDFGAACGTPTLAAESGTVSFAGVMSGGGNSVIIDHGNGTRTHYYHFQSISVKVGQKVEKGQQVGLVGSTGISTGCHLHFGLEQGGSFVDPMSLWQ